MRRALLTLPVLAALVAADPAAARLGFKTCGPAGFECARIRVPLDYAEPAGRQISLAVTRRRAAQPRRRIGALLVNYGGPGGDAVASTHQFGRKVFAPYRARFDLVAVDPRGTGRSRPALGCKVNQERLGIYRQPFQTPATFDLAREEAKARRYAERCAARNATLAPHVSTANVARDMDRVRAALGERRVSFFGFSYGTLLGATYARLFPQRVRALVLDGAVDPDGYLNHPSRSARQQTLGFELALRRYFAACRRAGRGYCRWMGRRPPAKAYDRLLRRADARPIRAPRRRLTEGDTRRVDADTINNAVATDLYAKQYWPEITTALNQARRGDASLLRFLSNVAYGRERGGGYGPELDRYFLIGAAEQQYGRELGPYVSAGAAIHGLAPHFYYNAGYVELNYALYTPRDAAAYLGPFTLPRSVPTPLVIGTTGDPATTYGQTKAMAAQLGRARLLTMRGDGHTAYGGNSRCVDRLVDRYVIRLEVPRTGASCRQQVPFPPREGASAAAAASSRLGPVVARRAARR